MRIMPNSSNHNAWDYREIANADYPIRRNPAPGIMQSVFSFSDAANHDEVRPKYSQPRR
jgi:hypothetical protein